MRQILLPKTRLLAVVLDVSKISVRSVLLNLTDQPFTSLSSLLHDNTSANSTGAAAAGSPHGAHPNNVSEDRGLAAAAAAGTTAGVYEATLTGPQGESCVSGKPSKFT
jgi:hypothetical protein